MSIEDQTTVERSRKIHAALLQAFSRTTQTAIADALGVSPSSVTRIKENELEHIAQVLAAAGCDVVQWGWVAEDPAEKAALKLLASKYLAIDPDSLGPKS